MNLESKGPLKASWCIFSGASDFNNRSTDVLASSHRNYTLEDQDSHYISALRNWLADYVKKNGSLAYSRTVKLIDRNRELAEEKDLIVHVSHKAKNQNDTISLFIQDDTDACEAVVYDIYNYIQPGDVVRIRSFKTFQK